MRLLSTFRTFPGSVVTRVAVLSVLCTSFLVVGRAFAQSASEKTRIVTWETQLDWKKTSFFFDAAPLPQFPADHSAAIAEYEDKKHHPPEVHFSFSAEGGKIKHFKTSAQDGPKELATYVRTWVTGSWHLKKDVAGSFEFSLAFKSPRTVLPSPTFTASIPPRDPLILKAPKPPFPDQFTADINTFQERTGHGPHYIFHIDVINGAIDQVTISDQKGPAGPGNYIGAWIQTHWIFKPGSTGKYSVPIGLIL